MARKLCHAKGTAFIAYRSLGSRTTKGSPGSDELREPLLVLWMFFLGYVLLELKTGRLQLPERCQGWRGQFCVAVLIGTIRKFETQRAESSFIMYTKEKIPLRQGLRATTLVARAHVLSALHQQAPPTIRR